MSVTTENYSCNGLTRPFNFSLSYKTTIEVLNEEILHESTCIYYCHIVLGSLAHAGERLSSDELKAFYTNKTLTGVHFKRDLSKTYYGEEGTVSSKSEDGTERNGKWWIDEDSNKRCIRWSHNAKGFCNYVERSDDGTHALIHDMKGRRLVEIKSSQEGNQL